jgi:hypothetical protein
MFNMIIRDVDVATILKETNGKYLVRYSKGKPDTQGADITVVDILYKKSNETIDEFKQRVKKYFKDVLGIDVQ